MQLREIEHQAGQKRLAGALRRGAQTAGETELDGTRSFMDLDGGRETQHVVHGRVHETHGARDGGADDVGACLGIAAVALRVEADDALSLGEEGNGRHGLEADLADLNLGIRLTMTLAFTVALLGVVLEDTDLLALAVLDDLGVNLRALHHGSAELGVLAVHDGQNGVEGNGLAGLDVQLLDEKRITLGNVVLLTTGHDNCLHACCTCLSFITDSLSGASGRSRNLIPIQSGL